jgi:hypothetical protein
VGRGVGGGGGVLSDGVEEENEEEEASRRKRKRSWRPGAGAPNIYGRADSREKPREAKDEAQNNTEIK